METLAAWQNFYVIVGSSAGALIGLQFVVITLFAGARGARRLSQASAAFATPTVFHFGAALLLAGMLTAPWHGISGAAILWGLLGVTGIVYESAVFRRMRTQSVYAPEWEDWLFHVLLPLGAYATLAASAYAARADAGGALFGVAAAALVLLFVGIHNAWDAVTYHIFAERQRDEQEPPR